MVLTDMNTNLSPGVSDSNTSKLINVCKIFGLSQLITEPTRVTVHSQSVIDLFCLGDLFPHYRSRDIL